MKSTIKDRTLLVREIAERIGFIAVGISKAERLDEEAILLEEWLSKEYHGEMSYMANHFDMRTDPTKLVPGAKSVLSFMYNYFPGDSSLPLNPLKGTSPPSSDIRLAADDSRVDTPNRIENESFKISRYAYGEDYHKVVRRKLKEFVVELKKEIGDFHGRVFVDSAPVMERDWAKRSGLGWIGKNTLLIHPKKGSFFFLAEVILDIEFEYDHPIRDHCGTCTKCIDACPTEAISSEGYVLDASKCISYLTIELKSQIPDSFKDKMEDWIFGCDICQEVCPWNRFSTPHHEPAFEMNDKVRNMTKEDWVELTDEEFETLFTNSPMKRPGYSGVKRNIKFCS